MFLVDGMADLPIKELQNRTILEYREYENMKALASAGEIGRVTTIPTNILPATDTALYSLFGYDIFNQYFGRASIEAIGSGFDIGKEKVVFRCNLVNLSGNDFDMSRMLAPQSVELTKEKGKMIMDWLISNPAFAKSLEELEMEILNFDSYRHFAMIDNSSDYVFEDFDMPAPHDVVDKYIRDFIHPQTNVNRMLWDVVRLSHKLLKNYPLAKECEVNSLWLFGVGAYPNLKTFKENFGKKGDDVSATPIVRRFGKIIGLDIIDVEGATGDINTNYNGKVNATCKALLQDDYDFVILHVKGPDLYSHLGDLVSKDKCLAKIDKMLKELVTIITQSGENLRLLFTTDHLSSVDNKLHEWGSVPYMIYDSTKFNNRSVPFSEESAKKYGELVPATKILKMLFQQDL